MSRFFGFLENNPLYGLAPLVVIPFMFFGFVAFETPVVSHPVSQAVVQPVVHPVVNKKHFEIFKIAKVLAKADWTDDNNQPAWHVVTTAEGETILRIHGGHDGLVWGGPDEFIPLDKFLERLPVQVTKIMCCHPMQVRKLSGVKQSFFYPNHMAPIWGTRGMLPGSLIRVYASNPD